MSSTSRNYMAITPEPTNFSIPRKASIPSGLNTSPSRHHSEDYEESSIVEEGDVISQIHSWLALAKDATQRNTGLLLVLAAQAFFALMNVSVKMLNNIDPALELIAFRMIITYLYCIAYMVGRGVPDPILGPKGVRLLLLFKGFTGFIGLFGLYYSLQYLSLSDATVLTFLSPMCIAIAGAFFLGENFTHREIFTGVVSLVGVVLIARPTAIFGSHPHIPGIRITGGQFTTFTSPVEKGTQAERMIAVGMALIGVLGQSAASTTIRAIGMRAHPMHSIAFYSLMCVVGSTVGIIVTKTPVIIPTRIEWLVLLIMIGIFGFVAQLLLTMGLQRETAGRSSMAIYTQIVFATILEKLIFNAVPPALSIAGTLLIIASAIYVVLTKKKQDISNPQDIDPSRTSELEEGLLSSSRQGHNGYNSK